MSHAEWFKGQPTILRKDLVPVEERWQCPIQDCNGDMTFNGLAWSSNPEGFHHTCTVCQFTAVLSGVRYPRITYRSADQP